jgi:hypothetical protein
VSSFTASETIMKQLQVSVISYRFCVVIRPPSKFYLLHLLWLGNVLKFHALIREEEINSKVNIWEIGCVYKVSSGSCRVFGVSCV